MTIRALVVGLAIVALIGLAFLGGKRSQGQQAAPVKPSVRPALSREIERLKLTYPLGAVGDRPKSKFLRNWVVTSSGPTHSSSIERLSHKLQGIELSAEEKIQMQDVYNVVFEGRQKYERANARIGKTSAVTVIEIPSYEAFGGQLRNALAAAFESILGKEKAKAIDDQIGPQIDVENTYWGKYPQIVQADYDSEARRFRISRVINPTPENPGAFRQELDSELSGDNLDDYVVFGDLLAEPAKAGR